jgi:hypothetical protein
LRKGLFSIFLVFFRDERKTRRRRTKRREKVAVSRRISENDQKEKRTLPRYRRRSRSENGVDSVGWRFKRRRLSARGTLNRRRREVRDYQYFL